MDERWIASPMNLAHNDPYPFNTTHIHERPIS